ncbi:class I SAM-dependent methyltransferase [Nitratifractor sp.]
MINPSPVIAFDKKRTQYYKGIKIKADTDLHNQLADYILKHFDKGIKILDWGCGEGALSQRLKDMGCNVLSVDIDEKNFKADTPFIRLDFNDEKQLDEFINEYKKRFDLILGVEVIEHIKSPWKYIENIYRLCGDNTSVIVTTPNVANWWGRFWFFIKGELWGFSNEGWYDPGHINPILDFEIRNILRENCFEIIDFFNGGKLPYIWLYNWKRFLVSLVILPFQPFIKGIKRGWVNCYVFKKKC